CSIIQSAAATTIYTLSLHDALPISRPEVGVKTTPAFPDHACEFRFCSATPRESSRSAWSRRASARTPAKNVHFPDPGVHWSNAKDRKSTRLNSSHVEISYAVFCLKK